MLMTVNCYPTEAQKQAFLTCNEIKQHEAQFWPARAVRVQLLAYGNE